MLTTVVKVKINKLAIGKKLIKHELLDWKLDQIAFAVNIQSE